MTGRAKLAFLTSHDPRDRRNKSFYMAEALQKHCGDVALLGPARFPPGIVIGAALNRASLALFGKGYNYSHSFLLSKGYARVFARKLEKEPFDMIFAPKASTEIANLKT